MRKIMIIILAVILIAGFVVNVGCSKTTVEKKGVESIPGEETKPEKQVFELKFNDWGPEAIPPGQAALKAIKLIEERTNGNVKITPYFAQTLVQYGDTYSALAAGIADISLMGLDRMRGATTFNFLFARLFEEEAPDMVGLQKVYRKLLEDIPELQQEMKKGNTLWIDIFPLPPNQLHTTKKPVRTPADIKGMRITASGDLREWLDLLGAAGMDVTPGEWYMALERGLVDGQLVHWEGIRGFDMLDLFKYHTLFGDGGADSTMLGYVINLDTWNSLPEEYQKIIVESFQEATEWLIDEVKESAKKMEALALEKGHEIIKLTPEERKEFAKFFGEVNEQWIKKVEAEGYPGRESYEYLKSLFREYR